MAKILVCGDFVPNRRIAQMVESMDFSFFSQVKGITAEVDYSILNFESPVVSNDTQAVAIRKAGPCLKCTKHALESVKWAGFDCVTLANNHCFDYGQHGMDETIASCNEFDLDYVGGGRNLNEAKKILYKKIDNNTIAIINCCEHEFSIATDTHGGGNPLDIVDIANDIKNARKNADKVLLIIHGGTEDYQLPTPRMKKTYRFFIDEGADVVINGHQHCYSGFELYNGKLIIYGLGNLCFDSFTTDFSKLWTNGYMVKLNLSEKDSFELIPYTQCAENPIVDITKNKKDFELSINRLNSIIGNDKYLYESFLEMTKKESRYNYFLPLQNRIMGRLRRHNIVPQWIENKLLSTDQLVNIYGIINCESHYDIIIHNIRERIIEGTQRNK